MIMLEIYDLYSSKDFDDGPFAIQIVPFMPPIGMILDIIVDGTSEFYKVEKILWQIDCDSNIHTIKLPVPLINCYVSKTYEPKKHKTIYDPLREALYGIT